MNTIPHLGNIVGSHLPADVYARYLRLKGKDVIFIGGTDEHGTPTEISALKEGITPKKLCDRMYVIHKEIYDKLEISYDSFSRTSKEYNHQTTREIFTDLHKKGYILEKEIEQAYCPHCSMPLADRYIGGTCPECDFESARGDQCDKCGKLLEPQNLVNPKCAVCGTTPEFRKSKHLFFDLPKLEARLGKWIEGNKIWKDNARNFSLSWIKNGLEPRCITRDLKWGVKVPLKGYENKVFYVWFDAPIGYISSTKDWAEKKGKPDEWKKYWQGKDTKIIHFIGKDNIPFHAIIWPGMLMGSNESRKDDKWSLPWQLGSFEYLNYEHKKFSKSRGVGVFCDRALELYPPDYWRYVLLALAPEKQDSEFTWKEFQIRINNELADIVGNFVHRVLTFIHNSFEGAVPALGKLSPEDKKFVDSMKEAPEKVGKDIYDVRYKEALKKVLHLAKEGNAYVNQQEPWKKLKTDKGSAGTCLNLCVNLVKEISILLEPYIPGMCAEIRKQLNFTDKIEWDTAGELSVKKGHRINKPKALVKKVEDEEVEKYRKEFAGKEEQKEVEYVKFEDFQKMDLRVGKILSAEKVEKSDKLIRVEVDIGEKRTVMAGLAKWYAPKDLVGKKVVFLANLEPKKIMDVESKGMILAAEEGDTVSLVTVDKDMKVGSKVL